MSVGHTSDPTQIRPRRRVLSGSMSLCGLISVHKFVNLARRKTRYLYLRAKDRRFNHDCRYRRTIEYEDDCCVHVTEREFKEFMVADSR